MTAAKLKSHFGDNRIGYMSIVMTIVLTLFMGYLVTEKTNAATEQWKKDYESQLSKIEQKLDMLIDMHLKNK